MSEFTIVDISVKQDDDVTNELWSFHRPCINPICAFKKGHCR
ncbi:10074_t:CDS:2 [Funneliformis caledonium]|uniref:10074_t:CDS:1 n=1 Tax=Funneliformis caledonium TaxID=1117310 RepID=A0A9N9AGX8_9GLOM|nr:10074_t:CDS:2 [Funneliformis caledonium]